MTFTASPMLNDLQSSHRLQSKALFSQNTGMLIPIDVSQSARHTFEVPLLNLNLVHLSPKLH